MDIYTIGHSNYSMDRFLNMLEKYNINCVVDTRAIPYSKYNVQYDKESLKETLNKKGYVYIYMGRELAAKRESRVSYNNEGYCDFEKAVHEESFIKGVERLKIGCNKGYRIVLLGAVQDPIRCQRGILLGRNLIKNGFNVKHILDDYSIASQENLESELLDKYFSDRAQITIDSLIGNGLAESEMIEEGYKLANKEIGYRIEKLKNK